MHRCLRTLLLEGNPVTELPLELGNVVTLKALNLRHCPISFPPPEVVQQGITAILPFLRRVMAKRPVGICNSVLELRPLDQLQLPVGVQSNLELTKELPDQDELLQFKELKQVMIQMEKADYPGILTCPPKTAEGDRVHKAYTLATIKRKKEFRSVNGSMFPGFPQFELQNWKQSDERRDAVMRELKEKQITLEQRRRDQEILCEWREQVKTLQERKLLKHKQDRRERHKQDEQVLITTGITDTVYSEGDNGEIISSTASLRRQRCLVSRIEMEEKRAARDHELEQRIRGHMQEMQKTRQRSSGIARGEVQAIRQELSLRSRHLVGLFSICKTKHQAI
ncbi:leucine-rich repeat-containing protein 27 isoform X3 [Clupea harengus]|uniref:Leucine-rich repeat-containing protein 27 isoform X3 n=1 Tax=Clupea harengus TaxID=7950 RepID=A0A6P8G6A4_CLUHA|nr:leucine-rich repeat-containing protein 27 isoform X3 [Clupea harengus]